MRRLFSVFMFLFAMAGIVVLESRYVEYEKDAQKHHYLLAVFGRS